MEYMKIAVCFSKLLICNTKVFMCVAEEILHLSPFVTIVAKLDSADFYQ